MQELSKEYISQVAEIEKEAFSSDAWSENNIERELTNPNCIFMLLVQNNELIGYYSFYKADSEAYINNVAVKNSFRGKGYGKVLLNDLLSRAKSLNINAITLEVRKSNIIAQKLYESLGFVNYGVRPKFYNNTEDGIIYWYKMEE